jgi:hypothetical protein
MAMERSFLFLKQYATGVGPVNTHLPDLRPTSPHLPTQTSITHDALRGQFFWLNSLRNFEGGRRSGRCHKNTINIFETDSEVTVKHGSGTMKQPCKTAAVGCKLKEWENGKYRRTAC